MNFTFLSVVDEHSQHIASLDALLQSGYRYAVSLTHDGAEAEDLLQDACVSIVRMEGKWEKSYLFTTIRNRFIDKYRRNKKILFVPLDREHEEEESGEWEIPDVIGAENLHRALGALRLDEREVLFLAFVEGYTAQQIAELTHRPRGTVLSLLHRSKGKLRRLLQPPVQKYTHD